METLSPLYLVYLVELRLKILGGYLQCSADRSVH